MQGGQGRSAEELVGEAEVSFLSIIGAVVLLVLVCA